MAVNVVPRVALVSVTVAPGITAPCASRITPATDALVTCAAACGIATSSAIHTQLATSASRALRERTIVGSSTQPHEHWYRRPESRGRQYFAADRYTATPARTRKLQCSRKCPDGSALPPSTQRQRDEIHNVSVCGTTTGQARSRARGCMRSGEIDFMAVFIASIAYARRRAARRC